jgi:amino acid transporter
VINYRGVRGGATTSNLLTAAKLLPLFALAIVGLAYLRGSTVVQIFSASSLPPEAHGNYWQAVSSSAFLAIFMMSGFETVAVPAGEAKSARRTVPIAIIGSLMGSAILYSLLQLACFSVLPDVAASASPLPDVARKFFGPWGATGMGIAGLVSMAGYCAGMALVGPRLFSSLATDGYLPQPLERLSRFGTPGWSVVFSTVATSGLAFILGYTSLVDTANVAQFGQYIPVALAVPMLRFRQPNAPRSYRIPFGPLVPILATVSSVLLLWKAQPKAEEWIFNGEILAVGVVVWTLTLLSRRSRERARANPVASL